MPDTVPPTSNTVAAGESVRLVLRQNANIGQQGSDNFYMASADYSVTYDNAAALGTTSPGGFLITNFLGDINSPTVDLTAPSGFVPASGIHLYVRHFATGTEYVTEFNITAGSAAAPAPPLTVGTIRDGGKTATTVSMSTDAGAGGTPPLTGSYFRLANRAGLTPLIVCTEGAAIAGNPDRTLTDTPPTGDLYAYVYQVTDTGAGSSQQVARTPIFTTQVAPVMAGGGTLSQIDLDNIVQAITNSQAINSSSRLAAIAASVGAVQTRVNALPTAAQVASAVPTATDFVTALKADTQWQQVVSQVVKIYGAEWGGLIKQTDGSYNVLGVNGTNVIGNVHVVYDAAGKPTSTTKTVS